MWGNGSKDAEEKFEERMRETVREEQKAPETAYERQELGDALCNEGRVREAIVHYRKAVEMEGNNPGYHTRLGDAYAYSDESVKALAEYRKALKISPRRPNRITALLKYIGVTASGNRLLTNIEKQCNIIP